MLKNLSAVILKGLLLGHFSTESHFIWQLDVGRFRK